MPPRQADARPAATPEALYSRAYKQFQSGDYDSAIKLLRKHLAANASDDGAWNLLAASYYHAGLPKRGLRYLKSNEKRTSQKSYNLYYQGLVYSSLGDTKRAEASFNKVLPYNDTYASYSVFELGVLQYRRKKFQMAHHWLATYLQRYPQGPFAIKAYKLLESIQTGYILENVEGTTNPDMERALFRYNSLSLFNFPHFWLFQIGGGYEEKFGKEPVIDQRRQAMKKTAALDNTINSNYGIGVGTFNWQGNLLTAGYFYRQIWHTNPDRLNIYLEDPLDFEYFAFRPDLMERRHQLFFDFRRNLGETFYLGIYGRMEYARIGSSVFKTVEDSQVQKSLKLSDTTLTIPWIGAALGRDLRILAYYYLRKEINDDEPAFSNKSYEFSGDQPVFSLGLTADWDLPEEHLSFNLEYFHYEFIYNDIFLDYTRDGILASAQFDLWKRLYFRATFGQYKDAYFAETLRQNSCKQNVQDINNTEDPKRCRRDDEGFLYEAEAYWNYTQFHRLSVKYSYTSNDSPFLDQYDSQKSTLLFMVSIAFPSVTRVLRFSDRFADAAFTKENY